MAPIRLQKILSSAGVSSRRASEALILEGRVTVNGQPVTELGSKADPDGDDIRVDGRRVKIASARRYILMYKPRGYITSRSDPQQRPTVIDLLTKGGVRDYVYPLGRLDYDSEGLLLLTSDGALAAELMHPSHAVAREYHARVRGVPDASTLERLATGVVLDGKRTMPAEVELLKRIERESGGDALLSITIYEGRNRQVRRMCEAVGHPVVRLRRVRFGPVHDEHIRPGEFRDLSEREIAALKRAARADGGAAGARTSAPGQRTLDPKLSKGRQRDPGSGKGPVALAPGERRTAVSRQTEDRSRSRSGPRTRGRPRTDRPRRG